MAVPKFKSYNVTDISRAEIIKDSFKRNGEHVSSLHSDFLALSSIGGYKDSGDYYFAKVRICGIQELRYWKVSKRVSLSSKFTVVNS